MKHSELPATLCLVAPSDIYRASFILVSCTHVSWDYCFCEHGTCNESQKILVVSPYYIPSLVYCFHVWSRISDRTSEKDEILNLTREQFNEIKKLPLFKGRIASDSMVPVIQVGEEIVIDVGVEDIKRFDIVVIFLDGKLICHYLWRKNKLVKPILLQTRNMSGNLDYPVELKDYLGKVINYKLSLWQKLKIIF